MSLTHKEKVWLNDFATRGFRNIADHDYIAARQLYRSQLYIPFLWSAQQAIEKYLKAILLFNGLPILGINHNLNTALEKVASIKRLHFQIPKDCVDFIIYINKQGPNRYFEIESHIPLGTLFGFDKTVWHIRRFCDYFDAEIPVEQGKWINIMDDKVKNVTSISYNKKPHTFCIIGGLLEREIKSRTEAAKHLIWKNFYFGRRLRNSISQFTDLFHHSVPTHIYHPESLEFLKGFAKIETEPKKRK